MHPIATALKSASRRLIGLASKDDSLREEIHRIAEIVHSMTAQQAGNPPRPATSFDDLINHCLLKAEGARWAAARQRLIGDSANYSTQIAPLDSELLDRAKEIGCHLWTSASSLQARPDDLETLAGCFEAVAMSVELASIESHLLLGDSVKARSILSVVAEAQSALRVAVGKLRDCGDHDQQVVFEWLKEATNRLAIYVEHYMRIDDPASPETWPNIIEKIRNLREEEQVRQMREALRRELAKLTSQLADVAAAEDVWQQIAETLDKLVKHGEQPNSRHVRELLLPHINSAPDLDHKAYKLVLGEIRRFTDSRHAVQPQGSPVYSSPEIEAVATLLKGRSVVMIGGDMRSPAKRALEEAFQLAELVWIETSHGMSVKTFEPHVARGDVAVVLLAIRWASHGFGDVRHQCVRYGKPFVRLPAGYNPAQVAKQILVQCSRQLAPLSS